MKYYSSGKVNESKTVQVEIAVDGTAFKFIVLAQMYIDIVQAVHDRIDEPIVIQEDNQLLYFKPSQVSALKATVGQNYTLPKIPLKTE